MSSSRSRRMRKASAASDRAGPGGGRQVPLEALTQAAPPPVSMTDGWFGAGTPPNPTAPAEQVAGRRWDYQYGVNMLQRPRAYEPVSFHELRALADGYDLLRLVIETRKDQIARLNFNFMPRDKKAEVTEEHKTRVRKYEDFFRRPDLENFWVDWIRSVLEDLLVIDAPAIHVRRTLGGDVHSLDQIDGATIKRIVDDYGRTPQPPFAAYQQILKGMPAVNYSKADLVYRPRNMRVNKMYGFSPVEQVLMTVNIALRRQMWQLAYFTDGNLPDSLIGVPSTWTPDQIRQFQDMFDGLLQGNSAERRRAKFVPGEVAKSYVPTKDAEMFGHAEEWLARVICFCFGISHQALVKEVNRATAENAHEAALEDGMAPIMAWIKGLIDTILLDIFGETELEFGWVDDKELDPKVQAEILTAQTDAALMTKNEGRDVLGLDPDPSPEADMLMLKTATGYVPLATKHAIDQKTQMQDAFPPVVTPQMDADGNPVPANQNQGSEGRAAPKEGEAASSAPAAKLAAAHHHLHKAATTPTSVTRPAARRAIKALARVVAPILAEVGDDVAAQVERALERSNVHKADEPEEPTPEQVAMTTDAVMSAVDLSGLEMLIDATAPELERMARDGGRAALGSVGVLDRSDLVDQVNERAVSYAAERSAELVGRRVLADGTVIDNPSARWAISQSTRDMVRDTLHGGLRDNIGSDAIIENLQHSFAFSPARAEMISRTEIAMANSEGAMSGLRDAVAIGVQMQKQWILGLDPCDECQANADAGPIDMDEDFPSGDDTVPAHPNCECDVIAVVSDEESADVTE